MIVGHLAESSGICCCAAFDASCDPGLIAIGLAAYLTRDPPVRGGVGEAPLQYAECIPRVTEPMEGGKGAEAIRGRLDTSWVARRPFSVRSNLQMLGAKIATRKDELLDDMSVDE